LRYESSEGQHGVVPPSSNWHTEEQPIRNWNNRTFVNLITCRSDRTFELKRETGATTREIRRKEEEEEKKRKGRKRKRRRKEEEMNEEEEERKVKKVVSWRHRGP